MFYRRLREIAEADACGFGYLTKQFLQNKSPTIKIVGLRLLPKSMLDSRFEMKIILAVKFAVAIRRIKELSFARIGRLEPCRIKASSSCMHNCPTAFFSISSFPYSRPTTFFVFRYSNGGRPNSRRKADANLLWLSYPTRPATSMTDNSVFFSSPAAYTMRLCVAYREMLCPNTPKK